MFQVKLLLKMGLGHACCLGIADCGANFWLLICAKVYCPKGHSVPMDKINKSIRAINTCPAPTCGAQFSYLAEVGDQKHLSGTIFWLPSLLPEKLADDQVSLVGSLDLGAYYLMLSNTPFYFILE